MVNKQTTTLSFIYTYLRDSLNDCRATLKGCNTLPELCCISGKLNHIEKQIAQLYDEGKLTLSEGASLATNAQLLHDILFLKVRTAVEDISILQQ